MAEGDRVRVGIIGVGGVARNVHLPSLGQIDAAEVVAVCDIVGGRAEQVAAEFGVPAAYALYTEMLERERLDAAFVLTQPDALFRPTLDCLRAGKHVFMEKPPGVTSFQAAALAREARGADRILAVGLNRRHIPLVRHVLALVRERTEITTVEGRFYKHASAAFYDGAASALTIDALHVIDAVRWIAGGRPTHAAMLEGRLADDVPNRWHAVIRFDNGVSGLLRADYMTAARTHGIEIHGPHASAFVNLGFGDASCSAEVLLPAGQASSSLAAKGAGNVQRITLDGRQIARSDAFHVYYGYLAEDLDFIDCIREGRRPLADIDEAVETMRLVDLLLASRI